MPRASRKDARASSPGTSRTTRSKATGTSKAANAPLTVSREELLVDGSDSNFRKLVEGLLTFFASHVSIRDGYASLLGLTGAHYTIMLCIRNLSDGSPVNVGTVASHLRLTGSFITMETKALERRGLVFRERGAEDRRMVSLSLSSKGVALLDSIADMRRQVNDVEFGCLSRRDFELLVPLVERLIQSGERALALQNYLRTQVGETIEERRGVPGRDLLAA